MTLREIRDIYIPILPGAVYHYHATKQSNKYIVWEEDGNGNTEHADNQIANRTIQGTTDYFTKTEYDPVVQKIEKAMSDVQLPYRLNSIQYEKETGYIHYEWVWEVDEWQE